MGVQAHAVEGRRYPAYCGYMARCTVQSGDITAARVDAIVNAANRELLGGGGVDGAIHRAAGPALLRACEELRRTRLPGGLPTGEAVATLGFALPARWVIHTVGPIHSQYPDGGTELLRACHLRALRVARELGARTVAFPAISCGVYGWQAAAAAPIAVRAVADVLREFPDDFDEVRFVCFNDAAFEAFATAIRDTPWGTVRP